MLNTHFSSLSTIVMPTSSRVVLRPAAPTDVPAIQEIYAHHVCKGLGSFEEVPPDTTEMAERLRTIQDAGLPWLVAESLGGAVLGYAYAGPYHKRSAFRYTVEDSVYIHPEAVSHGLGERLVAEIISCCTASGYRQMMAVIGGSSNHGSIRLHEKLGFRRIGAPEAVGFKFGHWVDIVIMQRALGDGATRPPPGQGA